MFQTPIHSDGKQLAATDQNIVIVNKTHNLEALEERAESLKPFCWFPTDCKYGARSFMNSGSVLALTGMTLFQK